MNRSPSRGDLEALVTFGGFPEPLFAQDEAGHRIWQRDRLSRVVREDLRGRRPAFGVECKAGERAVSPAIHYFAARTPIPRFCQVHLGQRHFETGTVTVLPFERFCADLDLP
jgi:hypothetical protein